MKKILFLVLFLLSVPAYSQSNFFTNAKNITVEYKDAPIRVAIEQIMKQGAIKNYVISNDVEGFVSVKLEEQPFETALKIIMRANLVPLLYKIENDVLIIEKRKQIEQKAPILPDIEKEPENNTIFEVIPLTYIDPLDLQVVFGPILNIRQFTRMGFGNMNNGNMNNGNNNNNRNQNNTGGNNRRSRR